jgi:predicted PurR-regulated permease PerM
MLLVMLVGLLFALFLCGLTDWVSQHTHSSRAWSLALTIFFPLGITGLGGYLFAPKVADQAGQLQDQLPQAIERLENQLQGSTWGSRLLQAIHQGGKGARTGRLRREAWWVVGARLSARAAIVG